MNPRAKSVRYVFLRSYKGGWELTICLQTEGIATQHRITWMIIPCQYDNLVNMLFR